MRRYHRLVGVTSTPGDITVAPSYTAHRHRDIVLLTREMRHLPDDENRLRRDVSEDLLYIAGLLRDRNFISFRPDNILDSDEAASEISRAIAVNYETLIEKMSHFEERRLTIEIPRDEAAKPVAPEDFLKRVKLSQDRDAQRTVVLNGLSTDLQRRLEDLGGKAGNLETVGEDKSALYLLFPIARLDEIQQSLTAIFAASDIKATLSPRLPITYFSPAELVMGLQHV